MACPDPNALDSLVAGRVTGAERQVIAEHLDGCDDCAGLVAAMVRAAPDSVSPFAATLAEAEPAHVPDEIPPGTVVGRYEVESLLGSGGLGVVHAARDPDLGRRVALKLLRVDRGGAAAQARLLREAHAMARVSHPNVLPVFDVGQWQGRVFIAMELVDGADLRAHLAARPHRVREIVDLYRAAGQGLAAAHAAGLVHRDFKPDNVLVSRDGRVLVTDFGLARAAGEQPAAPTADARAVDALSTPLTGAGAVLGTPTYMAPEQHEGGHVDARTDQFGFCVALYEALYGERPFAGNDYRTLRAAVLAGQVRAAPAGGHVPAPLRRIALHGLAVRPGDRWPTMEALLTALGRDRTRLPRRIAWIAAAALAIIATAAGADAVLRARLEAGARAGFASSRAQIEQNLRLRGEGFTVLADLSTQIPIMREVAAARDQSEFGLATAQDDRTQLAELHASLRDADWDAWATATQRGEVAIADSKGRLLYSTGDPDAVGNDVRAIAAVAAVYRADGPAMAAQIVGVGDAALRTAGLGRRVDGPLVLVLARASVTGGVRQATFLQTVGVASLLADLRPSGGVHLALRADDGTVQGDVDPDLAAAVPLDGATAEVRRAGGTWLVQAHPVPGPVDGQPSIATLVMARPVDVGLSGLFPRARAVLAIAAGLAVLALLVALARIVAARR
jgi:hypothetical protein